MVVEERTATPEELAAEREIKEKEYEEYKAKMIAQSRERQRIYDAKKAEEEAKQAKEEQQCRQDLTCWAEKHRVDAQVECPALIEDLAMIDHKWEWGSMLGLPLTHQTWADEDSGVIRFAGDKMRFKNAFGVWIPHVYWCDYDTINKVIVAVNTEPGKL